MKKLTKADIVATLKERTGASKELVEAIVSGTLETISDSLAVGGRVELRGFGVFRVRVVSSRIGRNPMRPEKVIPVRKEARVRFRAGLPLQQRVAKATSLLEKLEQEN